MAIDEYASEAPFGCAQVPDGDGLGRTIKFVNPAGLQLVTQSHFMRAADRRFGEPEDLVEESLEYCR